MTKEQSETTTKTEEQVEQSMRIKVGKIKGSTTVTFKRSGGGIDVLIPDPKDPQIDHFTTLTDEQKDELIKFLSQTS